jgi:hypothetical protein
MQGARLTAGHRRRSFFFTTFETLTIRLHTVECVQTIVYILFLLRKVSFYCFCEFVCGSFGVKSGEYDFSGVIVTDHICLAS